MLTDRHCKNAACPPDKKRARFTDSAGLYLEVSPAGSKRWFWKMYADGKEGRMALGSYPAMGLADARKARDAAKPPSSTSPRAVTRCRCARSRSCGGRALAATPSRQ